MRERVCCEREKFVMGEQIVGEMVVRKFLNDEATPHGSIYDYVLFEGIIHCISLTVFVEAL